MRSVSRISSESSIVLLLLSLAVGAPNALLAQRPHPAIDSPDSRATADEDSWELTIHHTREACGKKWVRKLRKLTEEEYAWMAGYHHGLYEVALGVQTLMSIEILNTTNLRTCDLERQWMMREMTIRVTYFFLDGSQKTQLFYTATDKTFVNQPPRIYPLLGKALLVEPISRAIPGAGGCLSLLSRLSTKRLPDGYPSSTRYLHPISPVGGRLGPFPRSRYRLLHRYLGQRTAC